MRVLPKVFAAPNNKKINNNSTFSYNKLDNDSNERNDILVRDKINNIFKRDEQIYSIDCVITFKEKKEKHTVIGATTNHLITNDRKLISINEICDIELAQKK